MTTVRKAEVYDVDALLVLAEEMDRFYGAQQIQPEGVRREQLRTALFGDPPTAHALVALDPDGPISGFAVYSFLWPAVGLTSSLYLKELYVARHARRSGIGSLLMRHLISVAQQADCSRLEWTTDDENATAQGFYHSLGFGRLPSKVLYRVEITQGG